MGFIDLVFGDRSEKKRALLERARRYLREGRMEKAIDNAARAIKLDPEGAESRETLGHIHFRVGLIAWSDGDSDGALENFTQAARLLNDPVVIFHRGIVYRDTRQYYKAIEDFSRILRSEEPQAGPYATYATFCRGICYREKGEHKGAVKDFSACIQNDPGSPIAHRYYAHRALGYMALGAYPNARADLAKAEELAPRSLEVAQVRAKLQARAAVPSRGALPPGRGISASSYAHLTTGDPDDLPPQEESFFNKAASQRIEGHRLAAHQAREERSDRVAHAQAIVDGVPGASRTPGALSARGDASARSASSRDAEPMPRRLPAPLPPPSSLRHAAPVALPPADPATSGHALDLENDDGDASPRDLVMPELPARERREDAGDQTDRDWTTLIPDSSPAFPKPEPRLSEGLSPMNDDDSSSREGSGSRGEQGRRTIVSSPSGSYDGFETAESPAERLAALKQRRERAFAERPALFGEPGGEGANLRTTATSQPPAPTATTAPASAPSVVLDEVVFASRPEIYDTSPSLAAVSPAGGPTAQPAPVSDKALRVVKKLDDLVDRFDADPHRFSDVECCVDYLLVVARLRELSRSEKRSIARYLGAAALAGYEVVESRARDQLLSDPLAAPAQELADEVLAALGVAPAPAKLIDSPLEDVMRDLITRFEALSRAQKYLFLLRCGQQRFARFIDYLIAMGGKEMP